jgi:hypothetical protein
LRLFLVEEPPEGHSPRVGVKSEEERENCCLPSNLRKSLKNLPCLEIRGRAEKVQIEELRTFQILGTLQKWKVLSSSNWDLSRMEGSVLVLKCASKKI